MFRKFSSFFGPLRAWFPLQARQAADFILQDRDDLLLLLLGQCQLDRELVGDFRQRVTGNLRRVE